MASWAAHTTWARRKLAARERGRLATTTPSRPPEAHLLGRRLDGSYGTSLAPHRDSDATFAGPRVSTAANFANALPVDRSRFPAALASNWRHPRQSDNCRKNHMSWFRRKWVLVRFAAPSTPGWWGHRPSLAEPSPDSPSGNSCGSN